MVEYEVYIAGLIAALHMNVKDLEVHGDCILIISQSTAKWRMKTPKLVPKLFI